MRKNAWKTFVLLLLVAIMVFALAACGEGTETAAGAGASEESAANTADGTGKTENSGAGDEKVKIGYIASNMEEPFALLVMQNFERIAKEKHPEWELSFQDAKFDVNTELSITEAFIADGCDIIAYHAVDTNGSGASFEACNKAGIPVVSVVNEVADGEKYFVGASNYDAGKQMAEIVRDQIPENGTIVMLKGPPGSTNSDDRVAGFKENLQRDDVTILDEQHGDWVMEKGMSIMETWIQAYDKIDLLFSCSDTMTPGAVEALKAANRLDETMVISVDGTEEGLNLLKEGSYYLDMLYNATTVGQNAVEICEKILAGETEIEPVYFPMDPIMADNVDELMETYFIGS